MDAKELMRRVEAVEAGTEIKEVPGKWKKFFGVDIGVLIGIVISIVVGVALIPTLIDAAEGIEEEGALGGLVGVLPYVFVAVLILGTIAWIGSIGGESKYEEVEELSEADEIRKLQKRKRRHIIHGE